MAQDYEEGKVYEEITKEIFHLVDIELEIFDYSEFPDKQEEGIDAEIKKPSNVENVSLQIKMFHNAEKYGTFPWEVSRYISKKKQFVVEPHSAFFHVIIDPVDMDEDMIKLIFWIIKTGDLPEYYRNLWNEALELFGEPSDTNQKWKKINGKTEPYYRLVYKDEILYQLRLRYTAYQRNVRCFLVKLDGFHRFSFKIPKQMLKELKAKKYSRERYYPELVRKTNPEMRNLIKYLVENK